MPSTSPIAQPVRQCSVAEIAVRQVESMRRTIYPLGVSDKWSRPRMLATRCIGARQVRRMALEHALLVALSEQPASGLDLARRFGRSIGFFWSATHQQIYRVLGRMEADGWVTVDRGRRRPASPTRRCTPCPRPGGGSWPRWLAEPTETQPLRSELAVKLRGASFATTAPRCSTWSRANLADHATRLGALPAAGRPRLPRARRADRARPRPVPRPARRHPPRGVLGRLARPSTWRHTRDTTRTCCRPITLGSPRAAQPRGHGLDAHRPRGPRDATSRGWRRTSPSAPAAASA